jgi:hypothetical protein
VQSNVAQHDAVAGQQQSTTTIRVTQ